MHRLWDCRPGLRRFGAALPLACCALALALPMAGTAHAQTATTTLPTYAGKTQVITLPTNEVTLTGRIDGVRARWVVIGTAVGVAITDPASLVTSARFVAPGTYMFELQSLNASGAVISRSTTRVVVGAAPAAGVFRERLLTSAGGINAAEYRFLAAHITDPDVVDYRLGPKYEHFDHAGEAPAPTLWGPDMTSGQGLWPFGILPANNPGEPEKCLPPSQQPRSDEEELARGLDGAGWLVGGQQAFLPDNPLDPDFRFGVANTRGADGAVFNARRLRNTEGGLCMRMIASWYPDWWNRNGIAQPYNSQVRRLVETTRPDLPLVPVAIARGRANASQISFAAFKDGTIVPMIVGNSAPELFDATPLQLPKGMVPTAMAVTPYNEFLVVSVWDTNTVSGRLAFIALRPREMAVGSPEQTPNTRWYWGVAGAWTNRGMKLLGMINLPMAAPTSVDVSNNLVLGNPRGYGDNDDPARGDLARQSARDIWRQINPVYAVGGNGALRIENQQWSQMASGGYAVVSSRAENKVTFVNMTPLYQYYRQMYLTTQANYDRTADASTTDPAKWPYTFAVKLSQRPRVVTTISVPQPTSVSAGVQASGAFSDRSTDIFERLGRRSPREAWSGVEPERYLARSRAFVASMDGTVRIFNVQGLMFSKSPVGPTVPAEPLGTFKAGRNPRFAFVNGTSTAAGDDLWLVSRGDRRVTFAWPTGEVQYSFTDSRLKDPVGGAVSFNAAGYGGRGPGLAVTAPFISITDFGGKAIATYVVEPRRGELGELYPFRSPTGPVDALFGSIAAFPGRPFMIDMEEII